MVDPKKYVVVDIETNGLIVGAHDLLSLSFYKPDTDEKYERYFPLEKNKILNPEASKINGITIEMIRNKKPLSQTEYDKLKADFDLENREILHYGRIDPAFIKQYFYEHNIKGFEKLKFHNIKKHFITNSFSNGEYSKDNLCRGFGIAGVSDVHNGLNDCILEWKLFEKTDNSFIWCLKLGNYEMGLYKLTEDYYIPASRIRYFPNLKYAKDLPKIKVDYQLIYELNLTDRCENKLDEWFQPAGFASEKLIKAMLNANVCEDTSFGKQNFKNLIYLGKFSYQPEEHEIPVVENGDGTLSAVNEIDKKAVEEMNRAILAIKSELPPLVEFIKREIFRGESIKTQEEIINNDLKVFGYTDFSNEDACLEMKFSNSMMDDFYFNSYHPSINKHKYQFYVLSNNRPMYLLIGGHSKFIILKLKFYVGKEQIREAIVGIRHYQTKTVEQYSLDGKKITEYSSAFECAEKVGAAEKTIRDNCNGKTKLTKGFQFKYKGSDKKIEKVVIVHNGGGGGHRISIDAKHVLQFDKNGKFVKEFSSAKEAEKETGSLATKISMVCHGKRNYAGGFVWKYKE